jgi:HK97 gp10 family phage protein
MKELGEQLEKLPLDIKEKVAAKANLEAAKVGMAGVQTETPIKTGNLYHYERIARRKNVAWNLIQHVIFIKTGGKHWVAKKALVRSSIAGANAGNVLPYYWYFLEFGTSKMRANPFMLRGFEKSVGNAATRARDIAAYWVQKSIGVGKS